MRHRSDSNMGQEFCGKCGNRVPPGKAIVLSFGAGGRVHKNPNDCGKSRKMSPERKAQLKEGLKRWKDGQATSQDSGFPRSALAGGEMNDSDD